MVCPANAKVSDMHRQMLLSPWSLRKSLMFLTSKLCFNIWRRATAGFIATVHLSTFAHAALWDTAGPVAAANRHLMMVALALMAIVALPVFCLIGYVCTKFGAQRRSQPATSEDPGNFKKAWALEAGIWGVPAVIVVALGVLVWTETHRLDPYDELASSAEPLEVQVIALDWKWVFLYPENNIATVNDLTFPADRPISLSLTSATTMQSFFIPQLGSQIYLMPGMTTRLNLKADHEGNYLGENTQLNGNGFSDEKFVVKAVSTKEFDSFIAHAKSGGASLDRAGLNALSASATVAGTQSFAAFDPMLLQNTLNHFDRRAEK